MLAHIKDIFEENELYHSLNENMKYIKNDNITIKNLMLSCYEQYYHYLNSFLGYHHRMLIHINLRQSL